METSEPSSALPSTTNEELSPLEQDVLDEYERLAENMKKVICILTICLVVLNPYSLLQRLILSFRVTACESFR